MVAVTGVFHNRAAHSRYDHDPYEVLWQTAQSISEGRGAGHLNSEQVTPQTPLYDRIVIKISGESLGEYHLLEPQRFTDVAQMIAAVYSMGVTVTVVVGGETSFAARMLVTGG